MSGCLATKVCVDCKIEKNIMLEFGLLKKPSLRCRACRNAKAKARRRRVYGEPTGEWHRRDFSFAVHKRRIDPRDKCLQVD